MKKLHPQFALDNENSYSTSVVQQSTGGSALACSEYTVLWSGEQPMQLAEGLAGQQKMEAPFVFLNAPEYLSHTPSFFMDPLSAADDEAVMSLLLQGESAAHVSFSENRSACLENITFPAAGHCALPDLLVEREGDTTVITFTQCLLPENNEQEFITYPTGPTYLAGQEVAPTSETSLWDMNERLSSASAFGAIDSGHDCADVGVALTEQLIINNS